MVAADQRRSFVGRSAELRELVAALDAAAAGRGSLFLLVGEPGIGKTQLAEELATIAVDRGARVAWGRAWEAGGAPAFWVWSDVFRSIGGGADPLASMVRAEEGGATEHSRIELFDAVARGLQDAASDAPLVVVLEDLHAADEPTILLLAFIARVLPRTRILIVGTMRDAEARTGPLGAHLSGLSRDLTRLVLPGLSPEDVQTLVAARHPEASGPLARAVHDATAGNPLFVLEVMRLLESQGKLQSDGSAIRTPESVRDVVAGRLAMLNPSARETLAVASVLGRDFDIDLVNRCGVVPETLDRAVDVGRRAGLLAESIVPGRERFAHALIRDGFYASLDLADRARLHRAVAQALADRAGSDLDRLSGEIAHHHLLASGGRSDPEAVAFSVRAGRYAVSRFAYEEGRDHFMRAVDLLQRGSADERLGEVTLALGDALWRAGDLAAARASFERVCEVARHEDDAPLFARAVLALGGLNVGGVLVPLWSPDQALIALLQEGLTFLGDAEPLLRARLLATLAAALSSSPERERAPDLSREAIQIARADGDLATLAYCLTCHHQAIWRPDSLAERLEVVEQMVRVSTQARLGDLRLHAHGWRITDLLESGNVVQAWEEMDTYCTLADELRRPQILAYQNLLRGTRAIVEGRLDDADALNEQVRTLAESTGDGTMTLSAWVQLAWLRDHQGAIADVVERFRTMRDSYSTFATHLVWIYAAAGRAAEARREVAAVAGSGVLPFPRDAFWLAWCAHLSDGVLLLRDQRSARLLYDALLPFAPSIIVAGRNAVSILGPASTYLGELATLLSMREESVAHLERGRAAAEAFGRGPLFVRATAALARALRARAASGDEARAAELDAEWRAIADDIGMRGALGAPDDVAPSGDGVRLRNEGETWLLSMGAEEARLRDSRGMQILARLLATPGREIAAAHLASGDLAAPPPVESAQEVLDPKARATFRKAVADLTAELDEARAFNDIVRVEQIEAEVEALEQALVSATGLGGRPRVIAASGERARVAVTKSLKAALDRIADHAPETARHLRVCIRTGAVCSYNPTRDA